MSHINKINAISKLKPLNHFSSFRINNEKHDQSENKFGNRFKTIFQSQPPKNRMTISLTERGLRKSNKQKNIKRTNSDINFIDKHHLKKKINLARKNGITKMPKDAEIIKLSMKKNLLNEKLQDYRDKMNVRLKNIKDTSRFNFDLRERYINTLNKINEHKLKTLKDKCDIANNLYKKQKLKYKKKKNFLNYGDVLNFKKTLIKNKNILFFIFV